MMNTQIFQQDALGCDEQWNMNCNLLNEYFIKDRRCPPQSCIVNGQNEDIKLGNLIRNQRQHYKNKTLSTERIEQLDALKEYGWVYWLGF